MTTKLRQPDGRPRAPAVLLLLALTAFATGGCGGRFVTRTEFLAPGFGRSALHDRTVAVVAPDAASDVKGGELAGVVRGIREAGARARVLEAGSAGPVPDRIRAVTAVEPGAFPAAPANPLTLLADFADPYSNAAGEASRRWGRGADAKYLLVVRVTEADVLRRFATHRPAQAGESGGLAERSSGRRVGLRLALVRLSDQATLWVASGTGEDWETRAGFGSGAATVDDDLAAGRLPLYPAPPTAQSVAARLTRRLIARLPDPTELEPS